MLAGAFVVSTGSFCLGVRKTETPEKSLCNCRASTVLPDPLEPAIRQCVASVIDPVAKLVDRHGLAGVVLLATNDIDNYPEHYLGDRGHTAALSRP